MTLPLRLFLSALLLPPLLVKGDPCVLRQDVSICAMCSDRHAAGRWNTTLKDFGSFRLTYTCRFPNGTTLYNHSTEDDKCFENYPIGDNSAPRTGVSTIGRELWTGVICTFLVVYNHGSAAVAVPRVSECTIKSPEVCTANPEECQVDRISELNEDGECQYHCAEGLAGDICTNVNECVVGNTMCDENAECHDTDGSYWCQCRPGFTGDGYNCTEVNACDNVTCSDENAHCVNSVGNYSCKCNPGFTGDGYNCSDIDECKAQNDTCSDENAYCINSVGNFSCYCNPGFIGDGYTCFDKNECDANNPCSDESAHCVNSVGNYSCQCNPGFTGDGYNCSDIDECSEELYICPNTTVCVNLLGSYNCSSRHYDSKETILVVVLVILAVGLSLILILAITIAVRAAHHYITKSNKLSFHDLAQMELDPYYAPKLWEGSLMSLHSVYEKLTFSSSTTDIICSEYQTEYHDKDRVSIGTEEEVSALSSSHAVELDEGEVLEATSHAEGYNEPTAQDMRPPYHGSHTSVVIEEDDHADLPDVKVHLCTDGETLHMAACYSTSSDDRDIENIYATNYTGSSLSKESRPNEGLVHMLHHGTSNGYVSEDTISELMIPSAATDKSDRELGVNDITTCSSGYRTESVTSLSTEQEMCLSETLQWNRQHRDASEKVYVASSDSSGYASGSTASESGCFQPSNISVQEPQSTRHSRCDCGPSCTQSMLCTVLEENNHCTHHNSSNHVNCYDSQLTSSLCPSSEMSHQQAEESPVKFTVNSNQELEYINAIEDTLSGISFDIAT